MTKSVIERERDAIRMDVTFIFCSFGYLAFKRTQLEIVFQHVFAFVFNDFESYTYTHAAKKSHANNHKFTY